METNEDGKYLYFLNSFYQKPRFTRDPVTGKSKKVANDFIEICIKDCKTNETTIKFIENPKVDYYITKDRNKYTYPMMSIPRSEVIKVPCEYADRERSMATHLGIADKFYEACRTGNHFVTDEYGNSHKVDARREFVQKELYNSPNIYMGDIDVEDYFKNQFMEHHGRDVYHNHGCFKHGFLDIEADQFYDHWNIDDFSAPINSVTYFFKPNNTLYTFELRNQKNNPDLLWVENNLEQFYNEFVRPEAHDNTILYVTNFYDTEVELLEAMWHTIHMTKPDFVGIWNMNFDIPYILNRMSILDMDIPNTCCHPDVPEKYRLVKYKEDKDRRQDFQKKSGDDNKHPSRLWDWVYISGYTQFYDQMALYSLIRKRSILPSYKLDDIAYEETEYRKLDYHTKGYTIRKLAHQNFKIFMAYSMIDTIRLKQIEDKTDDFHRSIIFADNTKLETSQKISYVIKNKMMRYYLDDKSGTRIIGNNVTYNVKEKIDGAIIASPDNLKLKGQGVLGSVGYTYDDVVDFDEASEYPRTIQTFNISKNSIWGRMRKIYVNDVEHPEMKADEFNKALQTLSTSIFSNGSEYFGLPSVDQILQKFEKIYDNDAIRRIEERKLV